MECRLAVKAFITRDNRLLVLQRDEDASHQPGEWDVPGGRLHTGEDPFDGLKREVSEETGLVAEVREPLGVHHFTREDEQRITMIIFRCTAEGDVELSDEHTAHDWVSMAKARELLHTAHEQEIARYEKMF